MTDDVDSIALSKAEETDLPRALLELCAPRRRRRVACGLRFGRRRP
ncbi:hypothetical protein [Amycolatopsis sp. GA6-003]